VISRELIDAALDRVVDPCSVSVGAHLGLAEMGLVRSVREPSPGRLEVVLTMTSPCCSYGPGLAAAAQAELAKVAGVRSVSVELDHGGVWSEALVTAAARERLAEGREVRLGGGAVAPYRWDVS
jgi:metal-sulfur cluster biosynthetic enzyme